MSDSSADESCAVSSESADESRRWTSPKRRATRLAVTVGFSLGVARVREANQVHRAVTHPLVTQNRRLRQRAPRSRTRSAPRLEEASPGPRRSDGRRCDWLNAYNSRSRWWTDTKDSQALARRSIRCSSKHHVVKEAEEGHQKSRQGGPRGDPNRWLAAHRVSARADRQRADRRHHAPARSQRVA
jgi:hypothetical protein